MPKVATIIVDYNGAELTKNCLQSLQELNTRGIDHSIIVVDNGSSTPLKLSKRWLDEKIEVVRSESNLGFTGGNNLGITYAREHYQPDFFLLLNNDTTVDKNMLKQMLKAAENNPDSLLNPKIYFQKGNEFHSKSYSRKEQGTVLWFMGGSIDWPNLNAFHRGVDELDRGHLDSITTTDFVTGCCMLIPRQVIETVGLLDKKYFLYFEDVEYSLRAKAAGYGLSLVPTAKVWHLNAGSSGGAGNQVSSYYQSRNRLLLFFQFGSWRIKFSALRWALNRLLFGTSIERLAVVDWMLQRYGKRVIA